MIKTFIAGLFGALILTTPVLAAECEIATIAQVNERLAEVKAEYSVKVVAEVGVTVGHTYTHEIPAKKYGHLQYGSWGHKVNWTKYKTSANRCGKVKIGAGTAKLPTREVGWRYWTTSS